MTTCHVCLSRSYSTQYDVFQIHPFICTFHNLVLFTTDQNSVEYRYHISIICSSADGQVVCFHVLAIVSRAVKYMDVHVSH